MTRRRRVCVFVVAVTLVPLLYIWDALPQGRDKVPMIICLSNLKQIGLGITMYQEDHGQTRPPDLEALHPYLKFDPIFFCPLGKVRERRTVGYVARRALPDARYQYGYRDPAKPLPADIVCWDSVPHVLRHNLFTFLNRKYRCVLRADGKVERLTEEDFQTLRLPPSPP